MKTIICYWGNAEIGKTSAIRKVWEKLNLAKLPPRHTSGNDICAILPFCNASVGIASQGDPNSLQSTWLKYLYDENCEIIICASRTKGDTVNTVEHLARTGGYTLVWLSPLSSAAPINLDLLNDLTADMVIELIRKCLNS